MGKLLMWLVIGAVAWFAWQAWRRADRARLAREAAEAARVRDPGASSGARPALERIVRCARCGLHLPASEAVVDGEHAWCSPAHRAADAADAARRE